MLFPQSAHPSAMDTPVITAAEERLLRAAAEAGGVAYNTGDTRRDRTQARTFSRLALAGAVTFTDAAAGGWERGMWAAHLTANGWNALFRWYAVSTDDGVRDRHIGRVDIKGHHRRPCEGYWNLDGTCDTCGALRPLDGIAYRLYLDALAPEAREVEERAPRLWCTEHGRMRAAHITTQKVCLLPGSDFHDGGLARI
jgi:hypothetical protein